MVTPVPKRDFWPDIFADFLPHIPQKQDFQSFINNLEKALNVFFRAARHNFEDHNISLPIPNDLHRIAQEAVKNFENASINPFLSRRVIIGGFHPNDYIEED